jgi:hypothetical protein
MDKKKEKQEISVIGRLLSIEALLILMGLFSLGSGIATGEAVQMFWGGMIIGGAIVLHFVRKKDWQKHWEEQERQKLLYDERVRARKEKEKEEKEKGDGE